MVNKSGEYVVNKLLNKSQLLILKAVRNNPNVTIKGLTKETGLGHTAIQNNLNKLQEMSIIKRIGSKKRILGGYVVIMYKTNSYCGLDCSKCDAYIATITRAIRISNDMKFVGLSKTGHWGILE